MKIKDSALDILAIKKLIISHPMCDDFSEDKFHYYVQYPSGMYPRGYKVNKKFGKMLALTELLTAIKQHQKENEIK
jgi:hypothetical protein